MAKPTAADDAFSGVLTAPDVGLAVRLLKACVLEASSGKFASSSLRSALYGEYLVKILDRVFGEHKCVPVCDAIMIVRRCTRTTSAQ